MKKASYDQRIAQRTAKRRSSARLPFTRALRKLGFKRTDPDRDPLIYEQSRGVMKVTVQLWLDGKHRASNSVDGHHDKVPTDFTTLEAMNAAIEVEFAAAKAKMESDENRPEQIVDRHIRRSGRAADEGGPAMSEEFSDHEEWMELGGADETVARTLLERGSWTRVRIRRPRRHARVLRHVA
jgi:hypothetical protein